MLVIMAKVTYSRILYFVGHSDDVVVLADAVAAAQQLWDVQSHETLFGGELPVNARHLYDAIYILRNSNTLNRGAGKLF